MSFCTQCGKLLTSGQACECTMETRYCTQCGTKLLGGQICTCVSGPPEPAPSAMPAPQPVVEPDAELNITTMPQPVLEQPGFSVEIDTMHEVHQFHTKSPVFSVEADTTREVHQLHTKSPDFPDNLNSIREAHQFHTKTPASAASAPADTSMHAESIEPAEAEPDEPENNGTVIREPKEGGISIVPDYVIPMADEVPIRQYNIASLRNLFRITRGAGYLQVTNKRVIFRADGQSVGGSAVVHHEVDIGEVSGLEAVNNHRFSITHLAIGLLTVVLGAALMMILTLAFTDNWFTATPGQTAINAVRENMRWAVYEIFAGRAHDISQVSLLVGLIIGFGGITLFFLLRRMFWLKLILLGLGLGGFMAVALTGNLYAYILLALAVIMAVLGLVLFSIVPDLVVTVSCVSGSRINLVRARRSLAAFFQGHSTASAGYAEIAPTAETEAAIQELGAVINDVNNLGDAGIERWSL